MTQSEINLSSPSQSGPSEPTAPPPAASEPVSEAPQIHPAWGVLALAALPPLFFYILGLWYRWLRPDPEFLAFSADVVGILSIISLLGLQTKWGGQVAGRLAQTVGLRRWRQNPRRACLTVWLVVVALAVFFHLGSPLVGQLFNRRGATALKDGRYSVAVRDFRQAISLSSGNASAHYNLANAYEVLHDYEHAIAEYQIALELDDVFWPAYNNLGRLYLRARGDPDAALTTLLAGQGHVTGSLGQAVLHKNVGWAYLDKELPWAALAALEDATTKLQALADGGTNVSIYLAETYRLAALAHQALSQQEEAKRAWADSLGHALAVRDSEACATLAGQVTTDCLDAQMWAAEAQERLNTAPGGE